MAGFAICSPKVLLTIVRHSDQLNPWVIASKSVVYSPEISKLTSNKFLIFKNQPNLSIFVTLTNEENMLLLFQFRP